MKKLILLGLILIFAASAEADDLVQCPNGAFTTGVTKGEVIVKCGIPQSQDRRTYYEGGYSQTTIVDELVYDIVGCHAILFFVDGRLIKIQKF